MTFKRLNLKLKPYGCYASSKGPRNDIIFIRPISEREKRYPLRRFATINKWYTNAYVIERPLPNKLIRFISTFAKTPIGDRQYHFSIDNVWNTIVAEAKTYNNQRTNHSKK